MKRRRHDAHVRSASPPRSSQHNEHAHDGFSVLPVPLIREHLFSFVASLPLLSAEAFGVDSYHRQLAPLRAVNRQWKTIADDLWVQAQHTVHGIELTTGDEDEWTRHQQDAARIGPNIQSLEIVVGNMSMPPTGPVLCTARSTFVAIIDVPKWISILSRFQHVVRLDLSLVPFSMVGELITAASTSCPHVRALILPFSPSLGERSQDGYGTRETQILVDALQQWRDINGGFRLLHIPYWPAHHHSQLLEAIVLYCPGIWYLRGWHMESKTREITALGTADRYLWTDFGQVCTELREFDWRLASMWGTYVDAFIATPKPFLEEMVIHEARGRSNIDYALKSVQSILQSTPRLRHLQLQLQDRMFFLIAENHAAYADLEITLADVFVIDVLATCPQLERFQYRMRSSDREMTVTDHTLKALLAKPRIQDIVLTRVVFQTSSLVSILESLDGTSGRRRLRVHLIAADAAHSAIVSFLDYIAVRTDSWKDIQLYVTVAREDMVRNTYPRGILVKDLIPENDLQQRITAIESTISTAIRFHLRLQVFSFGTETQRHAICEMTLRINNESDPTEARCHINRTHVPRYKRKAGRLA